MQPRSQFSLYKNSVERASRGESGEIKTEYSLRKMLHMSWVPSPQKKKKNNKQAKICAGDQTSDEGEKGEEGEWASTGVFGSPEQSAERDSSASSSLGMSKLRFRPG